MEKISQQKCQKYPPLAYKPETEDANEMAMGWTDRYGGIGSGTGNRDWNQNDFPLITFVKLLMLNSNYEEQARKVLEKWNYQTIRKIGKGGFGHVVLASKFTNYMSFYAIKCFMVKNSPNPLTLKKYIDQEVKIMCNINHPNIVRYEASFQDSGWYFIVMEYCDMGSLLGYQSKMQGKCLGLGEACKCMGQILGGIQIIHGQNVIHRDIKCQNIFLKKNKTGSGYRCKIGDFGFAKEIDDNTRTSCGTTLFMAPEVLKKLPYSYEADIWSLGVVFYFMLFGDYPFKSINIEKQIHDKCINGFVLGQPINNLKQRKQYVLLQDFFKNVFDLDQNRRMKLEQMIAHKIFRSGDGQGTEDSFSDEQIEEDLEWCLAKVRFVDDLINDLTSLKFMDSFMLHASRFYLFKICMTLLNEENICNYRAEQPKHRLSIEIANKEIFLCGNIGKEYEILSKYGGEMKRIDKFSQGFNLEIQDFYALKQGYRNTLSSVYSETQKKIAHQGVKNQLKLRVLCCHLINRVFSKGLKSEIFPNFNTWVKKNIKGQLKKQHQFLKLKEWIQLQSSEKLCNEIQSINKKFYS